MPFPLPPFRRQVLTLLCGLQSIVLSRVQCVPQEDRDGAVLVTAVFPVPPSTKDAALCGGVFSTVLTHPTLGVSPTDQRPDKALEAWVPDSEERLILREEFTSRMHQHFLDGKDGDFDYRCSRALPAPPTSPPARHPTGHGLWGHTAQGFQIRDQWVTLE